MTKETPRIVEVRLLALVSINLHDDVLAAALLANRVHSVAEVVANEVQSNLESVPYVVSATVVLL
jgi:hypothetical protein